MMPPPALAVVLRADADGPALTEEPVTDADLLDARSEAWLDGFLRAGHPDVPLEAVTARPAPLHTKRRCTGFTLEASSARLPARDPTVHAFGLPALAPVAERAARRLKRDGLLDDGDTYVYELKARRGAPPEPAPAGAPPGSLRITTRTSPIRFGSRPLAPLLARARCAGEMVEGAMPVVFTAAAHEKAERYARKGAALDPAVETGSVLTGEVCLDPATGEAFVCVHDAIEVVDASQQPFALIYTSATWAQVQALLQRVGAARPSMRLIGQAHGHNFAVAGEPCDLCAAAKECGKTNVFVSTADRDFMRAVFCGQPFALCWIAGGNARRERVAKLFTLRAGVLQARGYHIVDDLGG